MERLLSVECWGMDRRGWSNEAVDEANRVALERVAACEPVWIGVAPAREAIPDMDRKTVLHSGPPIPFGEMCEAQRSAVLGALCWEGLADSSEGAETLVAAGGVRLLPNHHLGAVNPITGVLSASMPVFVLEDLSSGRRAWTSLYEGPHRERLSFGSVGPAVFDNLRWLRDRLGPALNTAVRGAGGVPMRPLLAWALAMGDEGHNRLYATTAMLARDLAAPMAEAMPDAAPEVLRFLARSPNLALHLALPSYKLMAEATHGIPFCSLVTAMAGNGVEFGIRVAGLGDAWYTAPVEPIEGSYFPGYGAADAGLYMGDSTIAETVGFGGLALPASPAMMKAVGGNMALARRLDAEMRRICAGVHRDFTLPALDYLGAPVGIDVRRVMDTGISPVMDTAIAHRRGGQIGVGLMRAPLACFTRALAAGEGWLGARTSPSREDDPSRSR